jgi:hypothetical protein
MEITPDPRKSQIAYHLKRHLPLMVAVILIWALFSDAHKASAQEQVELPSYWQFSSSGRLNDVKAADINLDGVDEFLIVDENNRVELISTSGKLIWDFTAPDRVTSIEVIKLSDAGELRPGIVIGMPNLLLLLSAEGEEIWRATINQLEIPSSQSGLEEPLEAENPLQTISVIPIDIVAVDEGNDGQSKILVLLETGELIIFDADGYKTWRHTDHASENPTSTPQVLVSDFDLDGQDEIVLSVFNPRRFAQLVFIDDERVLWDSSLSRSITDLEEINFREDSQPLIAVSTTSGHVQIFDFLRRRHWLRTLNTPATSLAKVPQPNQNLLAVGTESGTVIAFNEQGRRVWTTRLADEADRSVLSLAAVPAVKDKSEPALAAILEAKDANSLADAIIMDGQGKTSAKINNVEKHNLTQFVDSNHDQHNELLVPRFATLELLGMGVGNKGNVQEWEYSLNAPPGAALVTDLDHDGNDELIIGTRDGRLHSLSNNRSINWLFDAGGSILAVADLYHVDGRDNSVVVAGYDESDIGDKSPWIQLRDSKGEREWKYFLDSPVSTVLVADIGIGNDPEIIAGTENGKIVILSSLGELIWESIIFSNEERISYLTHMTNDSNPSGEIIAAGKSSLAAINLLDIETPIRLLTTFPWEITSLFAIEEQENKDQGVKLVVSTIEGSLHGLDFDGRELSQWNWPITLGSKVTAERSLLDISDPSIRTAHMPLLLGTQAGEIKRVDIINNIPIEQWSLSAPRNITDVHWYDRNSDGNPDIVAAGNHNGLVTLFEKADTPNLEQEDAQLEISSSIFKLGSINRDVSPIPDLLVIGENGQVQLFRNQENRPPFLTSPGIETGSGQYRISVDVFDVEGDEVLVTLEILDPESAIWVDQGTQQLSGGAGTLFWALTAPPASPGGLRYRFIFSDGLYSGEMSPPLGPPPISLSPWSNIAPLALLAIATSGIILGIFYARQAQTPTARASRIYQKIHENPSQLLLIMEDLLKSTNSPDLIPHIASHARQADDRIVANLADGLFILPEQPLSGVSILNQALEDISVWRNERVIGHDRWSRMCLISQDLLEAPSVTELSLLAPELEHYQLEYNSKDNPSNAFDKLIPILFNLRDSERVELIDDHLVYLNEASLSLKELNNNQLPNYGPSLENLLVSTIVRRWNGLTGAEIEDLQGRAELALSLKTKRLVPGESTVVVFEIHNSGRAAAENIIAVLETNPAFTAQIEQQQIVYLPPGKSRDLQFTITPRISDRFRIGMAVTFSDRNRQNRITAFGDMVHLLPPVRDFNAIINPYTPGTPLRQDSMIFFGREELFEFIAENAGVRSYRNVLILVGQRRTGKTSALLRLKTHLPPHLLPVYIDCQSLGVVPGMPSLLEELAWYISDALSKEGIVVEVPELSAWQQDPTRLFQRQFLPYVNSLLPEGTTLLLVFDEFEAFESLVAEGILPATFFTYLRHLMQHSERLNFIFVGTRKLEEMTSDYWSVLFNIALYRKIEFLDEASAMRLITEPVAPNLIYDDLALDKIMRVTAGHPYFLQLVCYTLVKQANVERSGYITISNVNSAVDEMLSLGEVHFAYLWKLSTEAERTILATVAHLMDHALSFHPEELLQRLKPYEIHLDPVELTRALNRLVERDILREVTEEGKSLYELKLGLVGLWVAKNKSLSKLYAGDNESNGRSRMEPVKFK